VTHVRVSLGSACKVNVAVADLKPLTTLDRDGDAVDVPAAVKGYVVICEQVTRSNLQLYYGFMMTMI
jgi:hypothetical protein